MWLRYAALVVALILSTASGARAQEPLDVSRLPINIDRLQRALSESATRDESEGLDIRYTVEVYGKAPPLDLFGGDERWATGPAPYGGPTHREMLEQMTPKEFRAPAADFSTIIRWLVERANRK